MRAGAVVAAAGRSRRMGREKTLLAIEGVPALERVLSTLAAARVDQVVVVVRPDLARAKEIANHLRARVIENPRPDEDLLSSIRLGLTALDHLLDAVFIWPADHPLVRPATLERLREAGSPDRALLPTWQGRRGHPALVGSALRREVTLRALPGGLRDLWRERDDAVVEVPVEDEGVVLDLDTPEDYARALSRFENRHR
jgi:molybdenum cofactor cytidylyltransferase